MGKCLAKSWRLIPLLPGAAVILRLAGLVWDSPVADANEDALENKWAVAEAGVERLPGVADAGVCSGAAALRGRGTTLALAPAVRLWLAPESARPARAAVAAGF